MSSPARIPVILNTVLLGSVWGYALSVFGDLPARIPVHFGASGAPDRWAETSLGSWLMLPIMGLFITGIMYAGSFVPLLGAKRPEIVSMPEKYRKRFLTLSQEERKAILDKVRALVCWTVVPSNALFAWIQVETHAVATGQRAAGRFAIATAVFLVATVAITAVGLVRIFRALAGPAAAAGA